MLEPEKERLGTLPRPTMVEVIPETIPVKVGEANMVVLLSLVTLPSPTIIAVIPETVPVKVGELRGALRAMLPSSFWMEERMVSVAVMVPEPEVKPVKSLAVTALSVKEAWGRALVAKLPWAEVA